MECPRCCGIFGERYCGHMFSDYARKYHDEMYNDGHERNARNYELAYQHLERYAGSNKVMFSQLTTQFINGWIKLYLRQLEPRRCTLFV